MMIAATAAATSRILLTTDASAGFDQLTSAIVHRDVVGERTIVGLPGDEGEQSLEAGDGTICRGAAACNARQVALRPASPPGHTSQLERLPSSSSKRAVSSSSPTSRTAAA
jgi:hypothetical protein